MGRLSLHLRQWVRTAYLVVPALFLVAGCRLFPSTTYYLQYEVTVSAEGRGNLEGAEVRLGRKHNGRMLKFAEAVTDADGYARLTWEYTVSGGPVGGGYPRGPGGAGSKEWTVSISTDGYVPYERTYSIQNFVHDGLNRRRSEGIQLKPE